ncbi:MAG TPA: hypothetical protein DET40_08775 [Lentisphaeria bacterium]|nr:MAG: hypothetical protein A2X45_19450 [Lentisphaerae bacterium GWF2_50_93]HCE43628.1 hypothetical protein [Lentisphaeria bacterium]
MDLQLATSLCGIGVNPNRKRLLPCLLAVIPLLEIEASDVKINEVEQPWVIEFHAVATPLCWRVFASFLRARQQSDAATAENMGALAY